MGISKHHSLCAFNPRCGDRAYCIRPLCLHTLGYGIGGSAPELNTTRKPRAACPMPASSCYPAAAVISRRLWEEDARCSKLSPLSRLVGVLTTTSCKPWTLQSSSCCVPTSAMLGNRARRCLRSVRQKQVRLTHEIYMARAALVLPIVGTQNPDELSDVSQRDYRGVSPLRPSRWRVFTRSVLVTILCASPIEDESWSFLRHCISSARGSMSKAVATESYCTK